MDPEAIDPRKALEIQSAFSLGGVDAVYNLGKADTLISAMDYLKRVQQINDARAEAMGVMLEDYTEAITTLHLIKMWVAENLPEINVDLWDLLMSIDTSGVES